MKAPHFIAIGSQRAGTTWLHNCLTEHPQISLPKSKELHYFDIHYNKGVTWYQSHFIEEHNKLNGEITPNYYQHAQALERIKKYNPNIKLIYILREPKSRAVSQYDLFKQSDYQGLSFAEALTNNPTIIDLSLQGKHLDRLYKLFKKEQVLVMLYDDLQRSPTNFLKQVTQFLNIESDFTPSFLNKKINKVAFPKTQQFLHAIKCGWLIEIAKASPFSERLKNLGARQATTQTSYPLDEKNAQYFIADINRIEHLINRDLTHWKTAILPK